MDRRIQIVVLHLEADLQRDLSLERICAEVNLSPSRLRHLFTAEIGMSPLRYRKHRRLERAKVLLESTFLGVKEIMHQVGFKNHSRFTEDFKSKYGVPPSQLRDRFRNGPLSEMAKLIYDQQNQINNSQTRIVNVIDGIDRGK